MSQISQFKSDRVEACLAFPKKLSVGEVELLRSLLDRPMGQLTYIQAQELQKIEQKLGLA